MNIKNDKRFSLRAKDLIYHYLNDTIHNNDQYGKHLAISGVGLLLEKELQFDFTSFLDSYSQNHLLFLKWEGEIINDTLYFLTKQHGLKINISNLSYKVL